MRCSCADGAQALSLAQQSAGDEDAYDYNSLLRHGIFEAYSGILNGMSKGMSSKHLTHVAPVRGPRAASCADVMQRRTVSAAPLHMVHGGIAACA